MREREDVRDEAGVTLVELLVSISLIAVVLGLFFGVLVSVQSDLVKQTDRTQTNDQVRQAVEEIDREVRSGNMFFPPQNETPPYMALRVYTQANAKTRETGGLSGSRCVAWRIHLDPSSSYYQLQRYDLTAGTGWRVVAEHVVNTTMSPSVPAFSLSSPNLLNIAIVVNQNPKHGGNVRVDDSVQGRNTVFGNQAAPCPEIPT